MNKLYDKKWLNNASLGYIFNLLFKHKITKQNDVLAYFEKIKDVNQRFKRIYSVLKNEYIPLSKKEWNLRNFKMWYLKNKQPTFIVDCETTTPDDSDYLEKNNTTHYMWAFIKIEKEHNDDNIYQLVNYNNYLELVEKIVDNEKWLTHNLSFDFMYYIRPLIDDADYKLVEIEANDDDEIEADDFLENKTIKLFITNKRKALSVVIVNTMGASIKIECSLLKQPFSVARMGQILADKYNDNIWLKKDLDYKMRSKDHIFTKKEIEYIFYDVLIVKEWLNVIEQEYFKKTGRKLIWKITLASTTQSILKSVHFKSKWNKYFSKKHIPQNDWNILNQGYYGGFTMFNLKHLNKVISNVNGADINSAHPDKMVNHLMPYGAPIYNCDNICIANHFSFYEVKINNTIKTKPEWYGINFIPIEHININTYIPFIPKGNIMYVSSILLEILKDTFIINAGDIEVNKKMCFNQKKITEFKKYIDFWIDYKNESRNNKAVYEFCKLMMNSVYGKFGQKPVFTNTTLNTDDWSIKETLKDNADKIGTSYIPTAIAIADGTRYQLYEMIKIIKPKNFIYGDTDSIYYIKEKDNVIPKHYLHNSELGKWGEMPEMRNFKVIGKKKYTYTTISGKREVKCAGLPSAIKDNITDDEFVVGFSVSGKKARTMVDGMPLIGETMYTIQNMLKSYFKVLEAEIDNCPDWYKDKIKELKPLYERNDVKIIRHNEKNNVGDDYMLTNTEFNTNEYFNE